MSELQIGDVAKKVGIATSTIRYYERIGLLPSPARVSGRRRYKASAVDRLKLIRVAKNVGWSLDEIKVLMVEPADHSTLSERWKTNVPKKMEELDLIIQQTQKMKERLEASLICDCEEITECDLITG